MKAWTYMVRVGDANPFEVTKDEWEAYCRNAIQTGGLMPTPNSFRTKDAQTEGWRFKK